MTKPIICSKSRLKSGQISLTMTSKCTFTFYLVIFSYLISYGQNSLVDLSIITEEISKEITEIVTTKKKISTKSTELPAPLVLKASVWPNPSNIGKVRLSIENLPEAPLFIQIFNYKSELIQEGTIDGPRGASLHHILNLPDTSGRYSIKLSDENKIIKDLKLEIL